MRQALYQKYRPRDFSQTVGQEKIVQTLRNALKSGQVGHAYLFAGQRGTGKTTYARILAQSINCQNLKSGSEPCLKCDFCLAMAKGQALDIIEIDAASNRGIDEIRELRDKIRFAPTLAKYKVYIIDEVHMLTREAFNALLKTLEEPPAHVVFIMATTEAHKLPATILSRVQRFDFGRIPVSDILKNLRMIAESEKIEIDDGALGLIAGKADGSHRDAISLLEQIKSYALKISTKEVEEVLGIVGRELIYGLLEEIQAGDRKKALILVENYFQSGFDISQLALQMAETLRQVLLLKSGVNDLESTPKGERTRLEMLAKIETTEIVLAIEQLINAAKEVRSSSIQSLPLELAVSKIIESWGQKTEDLPAGMSKEGQEDKKEEEDVKTVEINEPDRSNETNKPNLTNATIELDDATWKIILDKIKLQNHTLQALLRDIKPLGVAEGRLTLCAKFKFHKDKVSETKNRQLIEQIVEEVTGQKLTIFCDLVDNLPKKKTQVSEDELLKAAEEVFS